MKIVQEKTEEIISIEKSIHSMEKILWDKQELLKEKLAAITSIFCDKCTESVSIDQIVVIRVYQFEKYEDEPGWYFSHFKIICPACGFTHITNGINILDDLSIGQLSSMFMGFQEEYVTESLN